MTPVQRTFLALALVASCGKGGSGKAATVDLFGKTPVPPGDLAKVKPGMTQAQVKALFPGIKPTPNHSGSPSLTIDSGYSNAEFRIGFYSDIDAVASLEVNVPKDLAKQLETAWGPPKEKGMWPTWINEDAGYEASVMEMGRKTAVSFKPFQPLNAEFFGPKPGPVGALTKVKFGMTREDVAKAVPGLEGPPKGGGSYIPFNAGPKGVTLSVSYSYEDDKLDAMVMELPDHGVAAMTKAWGAPTKTATPYNDGTQVQCWESADGTMSIAATPGTSKVPVNFNPKGSGLCR